MQAPSLTIGIEEEYQIVDPVTRELRSYITEILAGDQHELAQVKLELHQSIVEVGNEVHETPASAPGCLVPVPEPVPAVIGPCRAVCPVPHLRSVPPSPGTLQIGGAIALPCPCPG